MTAPGPTDIDAETGAGADIEAALRALAAVPAPHGSERPAAENLRDWFAERRPDLHPTIDHAGNTANLICTVGSGPELVLYSHLDTSLTGHGPSDADVTGHHRDAPTALRVTGSRIAGFGLGVARAPAAAALAGFAAASRHAGTRGSLTLLLAGGGTHRDGTGPHGSGVRRFLDTRPRPAAAIVAKGGPDGLLHEEPGAVYLTVRVTTRRGVVLARDRTHPPGGLGVHIGTVIDTIEHWRSRIVRGPGHTRGQTAREAGIGSVHLGSPRKPDLLPAALEIGIYLVTLPGDHTGELIEALRTQLTADMARGPLAGCPVTVTAGPHQPGGHTPATAPIVTATTAAWTRAHHGRTPPDITGWSGSTDGAVFREYGIDTVRTGPLASPDPDDADIDVVETQQLVRFAQIYEQVGAHWLSDHTREG